MLMQSRGRSRELFGGEPATTNNRMELMAVIRALEALTKPSHVRVTPLPHMFSSGSRKWIHGWKKNGWRTADKKPVKNADLWRELDALAAKHDIEWLWVKVTPATTATSAPTSLRISARLRRRRRPRLQPKSFDLSRGRGRCQALTPHGTEYSFSGIYERPAYMRLTVCHVPSVPSPSPMRKVSLPAGTYSVP